MPPGDENGVIELSVQSGVRSQITLIVENKGTEKIRLKDITLLWSVNFFDYSGISHIGLDKGNLVPGNFLINPFNCCVFVAQPRSLFRLRVVLPPRSSSETAVKNKREEKWPREILRSRSPRNSPFRSQDFARPTVILRFSFASRTGA